MNTSMNSPCVKYPPTLTPHATSQTQTQTESPYKDLEPVHNELQTENTILKKLFKIMKMSYKIPEHILDIHKKLILSKRLLKEFIALLIKVNETDVIIYSRALSEPTCCGFQVIIEEIDEIKIKCGNIYKSLEICYNEIYNRIPEEFGISLEKVINI